MQYWQGRHDRRNALLLGIHHGFFCVGCCWALMLLMFAVGVGNIAWMLLLGAVMAVEKNMPWGRKLSAPLGVGVVGMEWVNFAQSFLVVIKPVLVILHGYISPRSLPGYTLGNRRAAPEIGSLRTQHSHRSRQR